MVLQGDEASASEVTAGVIPLPPHVHPPVCLQALPCMPRERHVPQPLQRFLHSEQCRQWDGHVPRHSFQDTKGVGAATRASDDEVLAWMHGTPLGSKAAAHHVLGLARVKEDLAPLLEILQALLLHGCQPGQSAWE